MHRADVDNVAAQFDAIPGHRGAVKRLNSGELIAIRRHWVTFDHQYWQSVEVGVTILLWMAAATAVTGNPTAPPAGTGTPVASQAAPEKERMICKSEKFVGSNRSQRICKTETEWRIGRENAKGALNALGRGGEHRQPTGAN